MKPFKKILFPVDLSDVSQKILPLVVMMAKKFEGQICLLFVVRSFEYLYSFHLPGPEIDSVTSSFIKGAEKQIKKFVNDNLKEFSNCKTEILNGDPADKILEYITSENIDLVIMGTHGRKGINHIIFGSVAERVVKNSPVPVLTVNPFLAFSD